MRAPVNQLEGGRDGRGVDQRTKGKTSISQGYPEGSEKGLSEALTVASDATVLSRIEAVLTFQHPGEEINILGEGDITCHQFLDLPDRMNDGGVIPPPKGTADLRQGPGGQLFR